MTGDAQKPKRMMSWDLTGPKIQVWINSSSLDLVQTCLRKTQLKLIRNLRMASDSEPMPLLFGSSFHKFAELFHSIPVARREAPSKAIKEAITLMSYGHGLETLQESPLLESARQAYLRGGPQLLAVPEADKRSSQNLAKIMTGYATEYWNDPMEILIDAQGPVVERDFEFVMHDTPQLRIHYFGTIDCILRNTQTDVLLIADHKTTSQLGTEFYNRCKPNHQYTGYVLGAREALGLATNLFMINGVQVAKTRESFARQVTERTEEDFQDLRDAVLWNVERFLKALTQNRWPMTAPNPCSMYGGCEYLRICELSNHKLRETVIRNIYGDPELA